MFINNCNLFKYQLYLLLLILQLFTTTPIVLGYNSNINNQTIQQQYQQHHYLTSSPSSSSSSAATLTAATGTSIRTQQTSPSSSTSLSFTSPSAAVSAAAVAASASGDSVTNIFNNKHQHSTAAMLQSGGTSIMSGTSSSSSTSINTNYEFIGRANIIRREPNLSFTTSGCHTCQMREQAKADNLASIKRHILIRLQLDTMPNITSPVVPREIIEKFYKNNSNMFHKKKINHNRNHFISGGGGNGSVQYNSGKNINNNNRNGDLRSSSKINDNYSHHLINSQRSYDGMQGDDPRMYGDQNYDYNSDDNDDSRNEEYEEEFYSVVNSLYVFPTVPRMRHNRKPEILHFSFTNDGYSTISEAILHVYIRGRDWIREYEPNILNDNNNNRREIILTINRVLRRPNSPNSTHTQKLAELRQLIPNGLGSWITIDVTDMVTNWYNNPATNFGVVIKTTEAWMKSLVVIDDSSGSKPIYIEVLTKDNRKRRTKRSTSLNCSESDNEVRCCRYPLEVDFRKFNWDWIIAPTSFNAYFCNGECKLGFLQRYPHTHIMQLSTAPQPCCSPTKMSPISLLYFNNEQTLVMSTIPNMAVDKCSCS